MPVIELMIFDFDGTLVSSGEDIAASVNYMLRKIQLPERSEEEIISFVGDGTVQLIRRSLGPERCEKYYDEALEIFMNRYEDHLLDRTRLYPGIGEVLEHFSRKTKLIVTNKRHHFTIKIAEALNIARYFDDVIARDNYPYVKPDGRLLEMILRQYRLNAVQTAVIGDGINDVLMAKSAGAWSCAFLNGLTPKDVLLGHEPNFTYSRADELKQIFQ